jgi:hypothetical protein
MKSLFRPIGPLRNTTVIISALTDKLMSVSALMVCAAALVPLSAEAATPRAGTACTARQVGMRGGAGNGLVCTKLTLRSTRRTAYRWLPVPVGQSQASPEVIARYGGVSPTAPTTVASSAPGEAGSGAGCVVGAWRVTGADLNRYLEAASGVPGNFVANSTLTWTLRADGTFTGAGVIDMNPDPTGVVTGSARLAASGTYRASNTAITLPSGTSLLVFDIKVGGQSVDVPSFGSDPAGTSIGYSCSANELVLAINPNGRPASQTWRR